MYADRQAGRATHERVAELLRRELEAVRESISRELCSIPTPIPGCDVHVNRLLEDRCKVVDELQRLARLRANLQGPDELLEFTRASDWLDQSTREEIARALDPGHGHAPAG